MSRETSPLRDRVVFVVGARRSGTNWLERILTAHPAIVAVPTETYIFSHGIDPLAQRFQHANPGAPSIGRTFVPRDVFLDSVRDLVDRVLLAAVGPENSEARYVVERTPWHASHLPLIADVYPDCRVLNIVRDGRDVARSLLSMPWGPDTMEEAANEWRKSVEDARRGGIALGDRYREVVYETVLRDPRARTGEIFDWLGLDLPGATWQRIQQEAGSLFNVDPGSPEVRSEKWRQELSASDVRTFERIAGDQLEVLGYRPAGRAAASGRVHRPAIAERARGAAAMLGRPRTAVRRRRNRGLRQRLHSMQVAHNELVANFERHVADGNYEAARELLSPEVLLRTDGSSDPAERRGRAAADALLGALAEHRERDLRVLTGQTHASPYGFTTITIYALGDGSRWMRTLAYTAYGRKVTEVGLYRHELRG